MERKKVGSCERKKKRATDERIIVITVKRETLYLRKYKCLKLDIWECTETAGRVNDERITVKKGLKYESAVSLISLENKSEVSKRRSEYRRGDFYL